MFQLSNPYQTLVQQINYSQHLQVCYFGHLCSNTSSLQTIKGLTDLFYSLGMDEESQNSVHSTAKRQKK